MICWLTKLSKWCMIPVFPVSRARCPWLWVVKPSKTFCSQSIRLARRLIHHPDHVESPHCETTLSILNSNWNKKHHVRLCVFQGKAKAGSVMRAWSIVEMEGVISSSLKERERKTTQAKKSKRSEKGGGGLLLDRIVYMAYDSFPHTTTRRAYWSSGHTYQADSLIGWTQSCWSGP